MPPTGERGGSPAVTQWLFHTNLNGLGLGVLTLRHADFQQAILVICVHFLRIGILWQGKTAAESAMREVIGQSDIASALAEGRERVADETQDLLHTLLEEYQTGILVTELLLQRADPPQAVIESYRDVQRAKADQERLFNEADAYKNRVVPEANGQAASGSGISATPPSQPGHS